jgi:hypothetical protein
MSGTTHDPHRMARTYYEVISLFPTRSPDRRPRGWEEIQGSLPGRRHHSPLGLTLVIETPNLAEAFQIKQTIWSQNWRWVDAGGVDTVEIIEFEEIKRWRHVSEEENVLPAHGDTLRKRLVLLAHGIAPTEDWIETDQLAAEKHRAAMAKAEADLRERRVLYSKALAEQRQRDQQDYIASGETRPYHLWLLERPALPPFEDWHRAITAGEEPRLLLPEPQIVERPELPEGGPIGEVAPNAETAEPSEDGGLREPDDDADLVVVDADVEELIVETLKEFEEQQTSAELAHATQLPEGVITRIAAQAVAEGRLREAGGRYSLLDGHVTEGGSPHVHVPHTLLEEEEEKDRR